MTTWDCDWKISFLCWIENSVVFFNYLMDLLFIFLRKLLCSSFPLNVEPSFNIFSAGEFSLSAFINIEKKMLEMLLLMDLWISELTLPEVQKVKLPQLPLTIQMNTDKVQWWNNKLLMRSLWSTATLATRSVFQRQWNTAAWVNKHGRHHLWRVCVSASGLRTACRHYQGALEQTAPVGRSLMMSTSWSPWIISLARTLTAEEFIFGHETTTERGPNITAGAHLKERDSHYDLGVLGDHEN